MGFAIAAFAALALILNLPPVSKVVLLPDADGKTGAIVVKGSGAEQLVSTAYTSASVDRQGAVALASTPADTVARDYAQTLVARPAAPISFTVFFEFGSAVDIAPVFQPVLDQLLAALPGYPAAEITVIGHTDRVGTLESNDALSLQRAETVRGLLLKAGVKAVSIEIAGRGEREPLVATPDETPEARNRRVEINLR